MLIDISIKQNKVHELICGLLCASQEFPEWGQAIKELLKDVNFSGGSDDEYYSVVRKLTELLSIETIS